MNLDVLYTAISLIAGVAAAIAANFATARIGSKSKQSSSSDNTDEHRVDGLDLEHRQVYNITTSGNINFEELPKSGSTVINIIARSEDANLEYRVAFLEGYVEWMLKNGVFVRNIGQSEIDEIRQKATLVVRQRFPEAEVKLKES